MDREDFLLAYRLDGKEFYERLWEYVDWDGVDGKEMVYGCCPLHGDLLYDDESSMEFHFHARWALCLATPPCHPRRGGVTFRGLIGMMDLKIEDEERAENGAILTERCPSCGLCDEEDSTYKAHMKCRCEEIARNKEMKRLRQKSQREDAMRDLKAQRKATGGRRRMRDG